MAILKAIKERVSSWWEKDHKVAYAQAIALVREDPVNQSAGFSYHALLAVLHAVIGTEGHVVISLTDLVKVCNELRPVIGFDEETQNFVLRVAPVSDEAKASRDVCAFGWTVTRSEA